MMEEVAKKLLSAIRGMSTPDPTVRVFVITENHFFRVCDGKWSWTKCDDEFGYANITRLDRGKILSAFAKLEFLVNECLSLHILSAHSSRYDDLVFLVSKLSFRQRIEALKKFGLINTSFEQDLKKLSTTRNFLAHEWDERMARFDGGLLVDGESFRRFCCHLKKAFKRLVEEYRRLQERTDYESYLVTVIEKIQANGQNNRES